MFVQKLNLKLNTNYRTSEKIENIIECLHLSYNHIFILTPYSSKSDSLEKVRENLKLEKSVSKITPKNFNKDLINDTVCPFLLVTDSEYMHTFGYSDFINNINNLIFFTDNNSFVYPKILLSKFFIKKSKSQAFVAIFILLKMFKSILIVKNEFTVKKFQIFFKVFKIENTPIILFSNDNKLNEEINSTINNTDIGTVIFLDCYDENINKNNLIERLFYISEVENKNFTEFLDIPLNLSGKYKYRIEDVYNALTPAVLLGKRNFDYSRFKNINSDD